MLWGTWNRIFFSLRKMMNWVANCRIWIYLRESAPHVKEERRMTDVSENDIYLRVLVI